MGSEHEKPVLITDAEPSRDQQLRIRQVRYGIMMLTRAILLIVAFVLVSLEPPLLWLWLTLCAIGMVLLPWMAVLIANDRLPKEKHRLARRLRIMKRPKPGTEIGSGGSRVVDVDS